MSDSAAPQPPAPAVQNNEAKHRFECTVDTHLCVAEYRIADGVMAITHTEVHPALQGRGLAAVLMSAAIEHARAHGLKVDPQCSYAVAYMDRHPQTQSLRV